MRTLYIRLGSNANFTPIGFICKECKKVILKESLKKKLEVKNEMLGDKYLEELYDEVPIGHRRSVCPGTDEELMS